MTIDQDQVRRIQVGSANGIPHQEPNYYHQATSAGALGGNPYSPTPGWSDYAKAILDNAPKAVPVDPRAALKSFARSLLALSYRDLVTFTEVMRDNGDMAHEERLIAAAEAALEAP